MTSFYDYREEEREYSLTVGQFAKLCGTTRDTLRYYYEQNIIVPWVNPENGYHYYSASQISSYFFVNTMRKAGCSIREITEIICNSSHDSLTRLVNTKILDMQKELYLINKKISALQLGMWILGTYEENARKSVFMIALPDINISSTAIADSAHAHHTADIAGDISVHLAKTAGSEGLSTFPTGVTIGLEDLAKKNYVYKSIVSLSFLHSADGATVPLPTRRAVCCYHDHTSPDIEKLYEKILAKIKKNRLKACSDLYIVSLINLYSKEEKHTYFKFLFLCVN
jgi:DNA-binding transcriptional MerR regulator/effector-binding domain-containing protein